MGQYHRGRATASIRRIRSSVLLSGTFAVVLLFIASTAASAASPAMKLSLKGSVGYDQNDGYLYGCSTQHALGPKMKIPTGIGQATAQTTAVTCNSKHGGLRVESDAALALGVGIEKYVTLRHNANTVNVSYSVVATVGDAARGSTTLCPSQVYDYTYKVHNRTASSRVWENTTETYCQATAYYFVYLEVDACPLTQGSCAYGYTQLASNTSGNEVSTYLEAVNYSNPAVLGFANSSTFTSYNASYGPSNVSALRLAGSLNVSSIGHWLKGTPLLIQAQLVIQVESTVEFETGGMAKAYADASGSSGHLDITGLSVS
jgi:hypothetical protein